MAPYAGKDSKFGIRLGGTWHSEILLGAGHGCYLTSAPILGSQSVEELQDTSLGQVFRRSAEKGRVAVSGGLEMFSRFDGRSPELICGVLGDDTVSTPGGAVTARDHTQLFAASNDGIYYTFGALVADDRPLIIPSLKLTGFTLAGTKGNPIMASIRGIGDQLLVAQAAAPVNTVTTLTNTMTIVQAPEKTRQFVKPTAKFEVAAYGGALAEMCVEGFSLVVDRNLSGDHLTCDPTYGVDQPLSNDYENVTLTLNLPKSVATLWPVWDGEFANNDFFGRLTFVHPDPNGIEPGLTYGDQWNFRNLRVNKVSPSIASAGKHAFTVELSARSDATTAHAGMTTFDGPVSRLLRNARAASLLT